MRILAIDIGTGTQDIILLDSRLDFENSYKMVLPSPTLILRKKIQAATSLVRHCCSRELPWVVVLAHGQSRTI